jgi:hypothetical protein
VVATLNIPPSRGAVVQLSSPALTQVSGGGLFAEYYKKGSFKKPAVTRVDPTLYMSWGQESPAPRVPRDYFTARWSGSFAPPASGEYVFFIKADDRLSLRIGSREARVTEWGQTAELRGVFKAGERYPLLADFGEDAGDAGVWVEVQGPDFPRAPLPETWLAPVRGEAGSWADAVDTQVQAPGGRTLYAKIRYGEEGLAMRTDSPLMQGLYEVRVPAAAEGWLGHLANESESFPLCVMENPEESRLDPLTPDEQATVARLAGITQASSMDDLLKALVGKTFGRELWRIPAMVLFALAAFGNRSDRWICIQRKTERKARERE